MVGYIPDRSDVVWLDFDPTKGKEIRKYRPALVLSSQQYHRATGLMICCPISTSIRGGVTEVLIDGLECPSVVAANMVQTLDWRARQIKFVLKAQEDTMIAVYQRLLPLMGVGEWFELTIKESLLSDHLAHSPISRA
jgi:mRNA interferase MazF